MTHMRAHRSPESVYSIEPPKPPLPLAMGLRGEPFRMIRSISLTELISENGVNVSYIIRPMKVLHISTSFGFVQWKL